MKYISVLAVISISLLLGGCGPLAAVSALGTTITNAAYNSAERDLNDPQQGRDDQALEVANANMNLGIEYMRQGAYERALYNLERAIQAKPDFAPAYNVMGLLYQRLGDTTAAENYFAKAIKLDPSDSSIYNNYGSLLCSNNRREEALEAFTTAATNPLYDSPEIAYTNAGICILDDNPAEAENYFRLALSSNKNFSPALLQLAEISYQADSYEMAHDYYQRYRQYSRQTPKSLWLGIQICRQLGYEDDLASYALLLRNNFPDTPEARLLEESML